jgi:hypothetical protein
MFGINFGARGSIDDDITLPNVNFKLIPKYNSFTLNLFRQCQKFSCQHKNSIEIVMIIMYFRRQISLKRRQSIFRNGWIYAY